MPRASRAEMRAQSATRRPSTARGPTRRSLCRRPLPRGWIAKPAAAGLSPPGGASSSAMGSVWIWTLADQQFPGAIQIVDPYRAKGHLADVAKAIYGAGTDLAGRSAPGSATRTWRTGTWTRSSPRSVRMRRPPRRPARAASMSPGTATAWGIGHMEGPTPQPEDEHARSAGRSSGRVEAARLCVLRERVQAWRQDVGLGRSSRRRSRTVARSWGRGSTAPRSASWASLGATA